MSETAKITPRSSTGRALLDPVASANFWRRVTKTGDNGCWLWTGERKPDGYGRCRFYHNSPDHERYYVHRYAYLQLVGPIPEGLVIDHLCRVHNCVNPAHMEPVTNAENIKRGLWESAGGAAINRTKTQCPRGHPYSGSNLIIERAGSRRCRTCERARPPRRRKPAARAA